MKKVTILGAGMAAFGAAHHLRQSGCPSILYEKQPYPGGHTATFRHGNFLFDDGPHISFTRDERLQELLAGNVDGAYEVLQTRVNNHWKGHWIKHPAQCNLHGLPTDLVVEILRDFIAAQQEEPGEIRNYEDWLVASYGRRFAETFPMEYGEKYHTAPASAMTTDWLGPRLYRPDLEEVLRGALASETADVHYVSHFRYPTEGGFFSYLAPFAEREDVRLDHEVVAIDPRERRLRFKNGQEAGYDRLISSLPLPELIPRIEGAPEEVAQAAERLACTICVLVNIGVAREDISPAHWTYFYDRDFFFTRLSFPHMLSPRTVPEGASSVQAECYFSTKYRPLEQSPESCIEPVLRDLRRCGLLREEDEILHRSAALVPYANIIFDHDRAPALDAVLGYLEDVGIHTCGRYGLWGYQWTDESFVSGEKTAEACLGASTP